MYGLNGLEIPGFRWGHGDKPQSATRCGQARCSPHTWLHTKEAAFGLNPQPLATFPAQSPPPLPRPAPRSPHRAPLPLWLHRAFSAHTPPTTSSLSAQTQSPPHLLPHLPTRPLTSSWTPCSSYQGPLLPCVPNPSSLTSQKRSHTGKSTPPPVLRQLQTL